jgi:hypothetical protein
MENQLLKRKKLIVYRVTIDGYSHTQCFDEFLIVLNDALQELNIFSSISFTDYFPSTNDIASSTILIIGAHLLMHDDLQELSKENTIIFNLEQLRNPELFKNYPDYRFCLNEFPFILDYNKQNVLDYSKHIYCQIGVSKNIINRINLEKDKIYDFLFYGSFTEKRKSILNKLTKRGHKVKWLFDVYGTERDKFIAQSKVILNISTDSNYFESIRVSYLIASGTIVISDSIEEPYEQFVEYISSENEDYFVEKAENLLHFSSFNNNNDDALLSLLSQTERLQKILL